MGGVSGVITAGIGSIFGAVGSGATNFLGKAAWELARAGAHGFAQGGLSMLQGGNFGSGFLSGALGSLGGSLFQSVGGSFAKSTVGTIAFSSFSGGVGSALSGGSFWQGAVTGAVIGGLNHAMHMGAKSLLDDEKGLYLETENTEASEKYQYKDRTYDDKSKLYGDILADQAAEQFGAKDILGLLAGLDNAFPSIAKPFTISGSSTHSSYASKYGSKILPQKLPIKLPTHFRNGSLRGTNVLGRFLGRMAGPIGWGLLMYDIGKTFYNTQTIYNKIINNGR